MPCPPHVSYLPLDCKLVAENDLCCRNWSKDTKLTKEKGRNGSNNIMSRMQKVIHYFVLWNFKRFRGLMEWKKRLLGIPTRISSSMAHHSISPARGRWRI